MEKSYDVAVTPVETYDVSAIEAALRKAIEAVGGLDCVRAGTKVALKANLVASASPDRAVTTHPAVLCALTKILVERGASVVIGDSPGGLYTKAALDAVYRNCGLRECEKYGATLNTDFSERETNYPDGVSLHSFVYTGYLADADVIIDVCKLKTHGMMGLSCAAKNLFGAIPGTMKPEYHFRFPSYESFADMIVDLNAYFKPVLAVCDAIVGMEGNGPTAGTPRKIGCLLVSKSTHKLDLVAADIIGLKVSDVPTLLAAQRRGLIPESVADLSLCGEIAPLRIDDYNNVATRHSLLFRGASDSVLGAIFGSVAKAALNAKPKLKKAECVGCNKCGSICPAKAITIVDGKAVIDRKKCIRCFCCQEFCPKGAMKVHRTLVARILTRAPKK